MTPHDPYAALRHRDFRLFLAASVLATVGAEMQVVAVGLELKRRTESPLALGLVGLVQGLPIIGLALVAGQVADRVSRRRIALATQAVMAVASLGLAAVSAARGPVGLMYACLGLTGVALAFAFPARWALLPELVPREAFASAVAWRSTAWQVSAVVGPALGGVAVGAWGRSAPVYLIDAALGLVVVGLYAAVAGRPRTRAGEPMTWRSLLAGVRFVARTELILAAVTLDMFAVLLGGAVTLLPIYAEDILHIGATGFGWLRTAPALGALTMAVVLAHRRPLRRSGRALLAAVAGFGLATIAFGVSRDPYVAFAMLFLTGAFDNVSVVVRSTLVQSLTPDAMRGRVSAVNSMFISASNELGGFESGLAARLIGTVPAVVAGGVGCLGVVAGVALRWPAVGRLGRLDALRPSRDEEAAAESAVVAEGRP